jgi:hypothetical protein
MELLIAFVVGLAFGLLSRFEIVSSWQEGDIGETRILRARELFFGKFIAGWRRREGE